MCLNELEKFTPVKTGYVVMRRRTAGGRYRPWMCIYGRQIYQPGRWYRAEATEPLIIRKYVPGFHVWHTLRAARQWAYGNTYCIVRVRVRGVLATGRQSGHRVTVARERMIVGEIPSRK